MKYIQFGIMAVLIFGLAVSPVFSNAFADVHDPTECPDDSQQTETERECTDSQQDQPRDSRQSQQESTADPADRDPADKPEDRPSERRQG